MRQEYDDRTLVAMTTSTVSRPTSGSTTRLVQGAVATAVGAVLLPRVNAVIYDHERIWHLDHEAAVLVPVVVLVTLALFAVVGPLSLRGSGNRPAATSLAVGVVSVVGVLGFWISAPIILGGLAVTLGLEGRQRDGRHRAATAGIVLGTLGMLAGATMWLAGV